MENTAKGSNLPNIHSKIAVLLLICLSSAINEQPLARLTRKRSFQALIDNNSIQFNLDLLHLQGASSSKENEFKL